MHRSLKQPENKRDDIWFIDEHGNYLQATARDVEPALNSFGWGWFKKLSIKAEVLRILKEEDEQMGVLWGFGSNPSPIRSLLTGYVAQHLEDHELAKEKLQDAVNSGCFKSLFEDVDTALKSGL